MSTTIRQPDVTRSRILEAARIAFAAEGYDRTSVSSICRRAGVTKGGFYHHFESKQALFLELLDEWLAKLDSTLDVLERAGQSVPAQLVAMSGVVGDILADADEQLLIYVEFMTQALRDPALREATVAPYHRYLQRVTALIEQGVAEESLNPVPAEATASLVLAVFMGLLMQALLDPGWTDWERASAEGMRVFLSGVIKQ